MKVKLQPRGLLLSLALLMLFSVSSFFAQTTVTGKVIAESTGEGIPFATIVEKGTGNGVLTDESGNYSIRVSSGSAVLQFSYLGMLPMEVEVGSKTTINVTLQRDVLSVDEVVVTALGIKRDEKTLTYAQQSVSGADLVKARDINFVNSLSGKTSGVEIKKSSSGPGGSTKIVLRGSKSISGDSQPLFVIDGIPMVNNRGGQPGMWGGTDQGDGLSQINPDDIESITILKGSNAAALYGSQGANGVVLITTKKGKEGDAVVTFSTGIQAETVMAEPQLQFTYGSEGGAKESWSYTKGDYDRSYYDDFWQTGINAVNSVTVSGGTAKTTAYFSYANTTATGVIPTNKYGKNNVSFKQSTKMFNDKVTVSSNMMLTDESSINRNPAGYYLNPLTGLYFFPRDRDFSQYMDYQVFNETRNMYLQNWFVDDHHQSNPYWILNKEPKTYNTKRAIAYVNVSWDIAEGLKLQMRGNYDFALKTYEQQHAAGSNGTNVHANGAWDYNKYTDRMMYGDAILTYNKSFGDISLDLLGGTSYQEAEYGLGVSVGTGTTGLLYPNVYSFQNLPFNQQVSSNLSSRWIKEAVFANAQIGYKDMVFLDVSGRNDWASTLAGTGNESYFYPAFGLTGIISEMFELPEAISFAKIRASHSTVANDVPFNVIHPQHTITSGGGVARNTQTPFTNMQPEFIRSMEIGTDWRFFTGRLGFDITYYDIKSTNQFISLPAPSGSGYTTYFVNAGLITNKGIEATAFARPVESADFSWTTTFNFGLNRNKVVELHEDLTNPISTGSSEGFDSKFEVGGSIGDVYVYTFQRDDQNRIMLDDSGRPLKSATAELIGNLNPDWSLGWNNSLDYKNFNLSFLINGKFGGVVVSQTEAMLDGYGVSLRTAEARDAGGVEIDAVDAAGNAVSSIDPFTYYNATGGRNGIKEPYVYDRTNIRLTQFSLGYNIPMTGEGKIKAATISLVGHNLFFLYRVAPFDPELVMNTGRTFQSLDNFNTPATRLIGFNLKVTF